VFNPTYGRRYLVRNHQKIIVADERIAIIGGANIDETYLTDTGPEHWRDLWLRIEGPEAAVASRYCDALFRWAKRKHSSLRSLRRILLQKCVADVQQRLPILDSASLPRYRWIRLKPRFHRVCIAQHQLRIQIGICDAGVPREQSHRSFGRASGGAAHKFIHCRCERKRSLFHFLLQFSPRLKAILTRKHKLRVM